MKKKFAFGFWVGLVLLDLILVLFGMLEIVDFFSFSLAAN